MYLLVFEAHKMYFTKDSLQLVVVFNNLIQSLQPLIDLWDYSIDDNNKGLNSSDFEAFLVIMAIFALIYKIKYLNVAHFYIQRFYHVVVQTWQLALFFLLIQITFVYAHTILYLNDESHKGYGMWVVLKGFEFFHESPFNTMWTLWKQRGTSDKSDPLNFYVFFYFMLIILALYLLISFFLLYFIIAAFIESFNKVSQNLTSQIYLSRAKILYENKQIFPRDSAFADTRFIIRAQSESAHVKRRMGNWEDVSNTISEKVEDTVQREFLKAEASIGILRSKVEVLGGG